MSRAPDDERTQSRDSSAEQRRTRRIVADGEHWLVREVPAPAFDRRARTHLVFETADVMRRVREFPHDWTNLSDEALYAVSLNFRPMPSDPDPVGD